jgi:hypothetical protein
VRKTTHAIENRLVLVDLNAERHVRAMPEDKISARINGAVGNVDLVG